MILFERSSSRGTEEGDREVEAGLPPAKPQEDGCSGVGSQHPAHRQGNRQLRTTAPPAQIHPLDGKGLHW